MLSINILLNILNSYFPAFVANFDLVKARAGYRDKIFPLLIGYSHSTIRLHFQLQLLFPCCFLTLNFPITEHPEMLYKPPIFQLSSASHALAGLKWYAEASLTSAHPVHVGALDGWIVKKPTRPYSAENLPHPSSPAQAVGPWPSCLYTVLASY